MKLEVLELVLMAKKGFHAIKIVGGVQGKTMDEASTLIEQDLFSNSNKVPEVSQEKSQLANLIGEGNLARSLDHFWVSFVITNKNYK